MAVHATPCRHITQLIKQGPQRFNYFDALAALMHSFIVALILEQPLRSRPDGMH
jgi:hypothetical protein